MSDWISTLSILGGLITELQLWSKSDRNNACFLPVTATYVNSTHMYLSSNPFVTGLFTIKFVTVLPTSVYFLCTQYIVVPELGKSGCVPSTFSLGGTYKRRNEKWGNRKQRRRNEEMKKWNGNDRQTCWWTLLCMCVCFVSKCCGRAVTWNYKSWVTWWRVCKSTWVQALKSLHSLKAFMSCQNLLC